jgi:hypothetical protein
MEDIEIFYPGTDYEYIILKWGNDKSIEFCSKDKDGDIEICHNHYDESPTIYLNQEQIKALITFLNKQIINKDE